jgi:hypothetical protein
MIIPLTWSTTDIVESEVGDAWVELQEQREWLTDTTSGTEDGDLGELQKRISSASQERSLAWAGAVGAGSV